MTTSRPVARHVTHSFHFRHTFPPPKRTPLGSDPKGVTKASHLGRFSAGDPPLAAKACAWRLLSSIPRSKGSWRCSRRAGRRRPSRPTGATSTALAAWLDRPARPHHDRAARAYVAQLRADGLSPTTIARRVAAIRSFFRHQVLLGARTDNPAAELELPRRRRTLPRTLSPGEVERLSTRPRDDAARAARPRPRRAPLRRRPARQRGGRPRQKSASTSRDRLVRCIGKGSRNASCRSAARQPRPSAATSRAAARISTAPPAGAVPQRARRAAHPRRRLPHPPAPRRESRAGAGTRPSAPAPPLVRDAPARGRRRPTRGTGDARACRSRDDRALHARIRSPAARVVFPSAPACAPQERQEEGSRHAPRSARRTRRRRHLGAGWLMMQAGLQKSALELRRKRARLPVLRTRRSHARVCANCARLALGPAPCASALRDAPRPPCVDPRPPRRPRRALRAGRSSRAAPSRSSAPAPRAGAPRVLVGRPRILCRSGRTALTVLGMVARQQLDREQRRAARRGAARRRARAAAAPPSAASGTCRPRGTPAPARGSRRFAPPPRARRPTPRAASASSRRRRLRELVGRAAASARCHAARA